MTYVILSNRKTLALALKDLFTIIQADLSKVCHTSAWTGCQQVAFFAMSIERNYKVIYVRNCVRYIQPLIVKLLLYHFSHCLKIINEMLDFLSRLILQFYCVKEQNYEWKDICTCNVFLLIGLKLS